MMSLGWRLVLILACLAGPSASHAHSVGTSYVYVSSRPNDHDLDVRVDLHVRDVEFALGVDSDANGAVTWKELQEAWPALAGYVRERIRVTREAGSCDLVFDELLIDARGDGRYAVINGRGACKSQGDVGIRSDLMFDTDAQHRTLIRHDIAGRSIGTVLSVDQRGWQASSATAEKGRWRELGRFIAEGAHHIWIGFDHLAFLFILLLPAGVHAGRTGRPALQRRPLVRVLLIVSAFTVAHSVTLGLAVLKVVTVPERPVEIAIALSVIAAALANLNARTRDFGPITAFGFGLLHGFGFANALQGLGLGTVDTGVALLGFNLGVELGQLAVVAAVLPVLSLVRGTRFYVMKVVPAGSLGVAALGTIWLMQRLAT